MWFDKAGVHSGYVTFGTDFQRCDVGLKGIAVGNRRAREFHLQQERAAQVADDEHARTEPRRASSDAHLGIGWLRLQLVVCPSFEESKAWEIRQGGENWSLYSSKVVEPDLDPQLLGFDQLQFESERLEAIFRRVSSLSLPLDPNGHGGADGTTYQLALFSDVPRCRFQWWSEPPDKWRPLANIVAEMIEEFLKAEGWSAEDRAGWPE